MTGFQKRSFLDHPHIAFSYRLQPDAREGVRPHRHLPSGTFELVFDLGDRAAHGTDAVTTRPTAFLGGLFGRSFRVAYGNKADVLGVVLKPGAMRRYFDLPSGDLSGTVVPLEDLIGLRAESWKDQLKEAPSTVEKFATIECLLGALPVQGSYRPDPAMRLAEQLMKERQGRIRVHLLAQEVNMSERNFRRRFQEVIGRSPKEHALQVRVSALVADTLRCTSLADQAALAFKHGYYDGCHVHRDAVKVLGASIGRFTAEVLEQQVSVFIGSEPIRQEATAVSVC